MLLVLISGPAIATRVAILPIRQSPPEYRENKEQKRDYNRVAR